MRWRLYVVMAAALLAPTPGQAQAVRLPAGKWTLNSGSTQCLASRQYGTPDKPLELELKLPPAGNSIRLLVVRKGRGSRDPEQVEGMVRLDDGKALPMSMYAYELAARGERILQINMPLETFAAVRSAKVLSIQAPKELRERFQLTSLEPLMKALEACAARLGRDWNAREAGQQKVKESARADLQGAFRPSDYPALARRRNLSGSTTFVILIDETGRVADCTVVEQSGVAALDVQSCAVMRQRVRFTPAIDFQDKPTRDMYVQRVTWILR